jgi:hypothetical protein
VKVLFKFHSISMAVIGFSISAGAGKVARARQPVRDAGSAEALERSSVTGSRSTAIFAKKPAH